MSSLSLLSWLFSNIHCKCKGEKGTQAFTGKNAHYRQVSLVRQTLYLILMSGTIKEIRIGEDYAKIEGQKRSSEK